jgi:hypothetical protein
MDPVGNRPPRDTGLIELRDFGPNGRRLGTPADCYDGSPWELHRGELVEQMGSKDIHAITMALLTALFRTHAREGMSVMDDVYCDLTDEQGASLRAPDVVVVSDLEKPRDDVYRGKPVLAVEVRGTQSKRYLEEKVRLYVEHDWPLVWIAHPVRQEVEVFSPAGSSVVYRLGASLPLPPFLDKHGLEAVPVAAIFSESESSRYTDGWAAARGEARGEIRASARSILQVLAARGLPVSDALRARILACTDIATLDRWLTLAATAQTADAIG